MNLLDCPECAKRRELMARWANDWMLWAKDPLRNPRPGSKEWLLKSQAQNNSESQSESGLTATQK